MDEGLEQLLRLLDVEQLETNYFRGHNQQGRGGRIFGGQVLGQALMAAGRTVEATDRSVHSLQSYFLLAGDPTIPIMFEVDRIRDGRSFTTRRVRAFQHGQAIFALSASFHVEEEGPRHDPPPPDVPGPDSREAGESGYGPMRRMGMPFDIRSVDPGDTSVPRQAMWMKAVDTLPDDSLLHACLLAYVSDLGLVGVIAQPHAGGEPWGSGFMMASLDHMMWLHRPFRMDEWLVHIRQSPVAEGARGLALGSVHQTDGTVIASLAQEGLIRKGRRR